MTINWNNSNSEEFQSFCNSLLWLELGDSFEGFEAPGRDGGIDGWYNGKYKQKSGKWRFQYKFHTTARRVSYQSLKKDIASEIKKIKDENHLILLANVPLNPEEKKQAKELAQMELLKYNKINTSFDIWEGAKINRLYFKWPILKLWMEEGYTNHSFLPYREAFKEQLNAASNSLYNLSNIFVSRTTELKQLADFVQKDDTYLAVVSGETGIGKTRLVIEFFKQSIDTKKEWIALTVSRFSINFETVKFALSAGSNYILLIDDAQNYTPQQVADITRLGGKQGDVKVKIILTVRNLQSNDTLQFISEFQRDKAVNINLNKLSKEDTRTIFEKELTHAYLANFLDQLVNMSRGRPILIVGILNAAANNDNISAIKTQSSFNKYIVKHFDVFIDQVVKETGAKRLQVKKLLLLFCLIEPFSYDEPTLINRISSSENIEEDITRLSLKMMKQTGFSSGRFLQSIKPDYYSDIFLKENIEDGWVQRKIKEYEDYALNILSNIASIDEVESDNTKIRSSLLDSLMKNFVNDLSTIPNNELEDRLRFIRTISLQKPALAIDCVNFFMEAIQNKESKFFKENIERKKVINSKNNPIYVEVKRLLVELLYFDEYHDYVFESIIQIIGIIEDEAVFSEIFGYNHPIYLYQHSVRVQKYFVNKAQVLSNENNTTLVCFLIHGLNELLKLSFTTFNWSNYDDNSGKLMTHFIPNDPVIFSLRLSIITTLQQYFNGYTNEQIKVKAMDALLSFPFEMYGHRHENSNYKNNDEIKNLLNFLGNEAESLTTGCKILVLKKLHWYKACLLPDIFHPDLNTASQLFAPKSALDSIIEALIEFETNNVDEKERVLKLDEIINASSIEDLSYALSHIYNTHNHSLLFYDGFISHMYSRYPGKARDAYIILKSANRPFINSYGSNFLRMLRKCTQFEGFYWEEVEFFRNEKSTEAFNILLHIYFIYHWSDLTILTERDASVITEIFLIRSKETKHNLVYALPTLYFILGDGAKHYLEEFLRDCSQEEGEILFRILLDKYGQDVYIFTIFFEHSLRFHLNHKLEQCLVTAAANKTVDEVFNYFMNRFKYKLSNPSENSIFPYTFVPDSNFCVFTQQSSREIIFPLFFKTLEWYVFLKLEWPQMQAANGLIPYLQPNKQIDEEMMRAYLSIFELCKADCIAVSHLLETLQHFRVKSLELFHLISIIIEESLSKFTHEKSCIDKLSFKCQQAIMSSGSKSGTPGQPFPFDLQLKLLIESAFPTFKSQIHMSKILQETLKQVNQTIAQDSEFLLKEDW